LHSQRTENKRKLISDNEINDYFQEIPLPKTLINQNLPNEKSFISPIKSPPQFSRKLPEVNTNLPNTYNDRDYNGQLN